MAGSVLALFLVGLGAVQALPAGKPVEERQSGIWIGDGSAIFTPGKGALPLCLTDIPLNEQPPCLLPPIVGGLEPPKEKRLAEETAPVKKRQLIIGDGSGVLIPGQGSMPACLTDIPLNEQPPCILPPIVGGLEPPKKRQLIIGDGSGVLIPGQGSMPVCRTDIPLNEQPPCMLPPIVGGLEPPKKRLAEESAPVKKRQLVIGDGSGAFIPGQGSMPVCRTDIPLNEQPPCMLPPIVGGLEPPTVTPPIITPAKQKRGFTLPPDYASNTKKVIEALELELIKLQNKPRKTKEDLDDIEAIKAALKHLAGITSISAPPGTGSTFTPGKRDEFSLGGTGAYAAECPNLEGAEIALEKLMHKDKPTVEERIIMQKLAAFLKACGITIIKSPDGTYTIIKPSDKKRRDVSAQFDLAGLQAAYSALLSAAAAVAPNKPSFSNWLALQQISGLLEIYGAAPAADASAAASSAGRSKRQTKSCQVDDIMGLRAALAALLTAYGDPSKAPTNIFLIEQVIVTALQLCGQSVPGWTTLIPGSPIPGAPLVPDPATPGAPLVPDPITPGAPLVPDPTIPGAPLVPSDKLRVRLAASDPSALLATLKALEDAYGTYGSGRIPAPVWLIMVNVVTILQSTPGVVVSGWPVLGQGSVVLTPST